MGEILSLIIVLVIVFLLSSIFFGSPKPKEEAERTWEFSGARIDLFGDSFKVTSTEGISSILISSVSNIVYSTPIGSNHSFIKIYSVSGLSTTMKVARSPESEQLASQVLSFVLDRNKSHTELIQQLAVSSDSSAPIDTTESLVASSLKINEICEKAIRLARDGKFDQAFQTHQMAVLSLGVAQQGHFITFAFLHELCSKTHFDILLAEHHINKNSKTAIELLYAYLLWKLSRYTYLFYRGDTVAEYKQDFMNYPNSIFGEPIIAEAMALSGVDESLIEKSFFKQAFSELPDFIKITKEEFIELTSKGSINGDTYQFRQKVNQTSPEFYLITSSIWATNLLKTV